MINVYCSLCPLTSSLLWVVFPGSVCYEAPTEYYVLIVDFFEHTLGIQLRVFGPASDDVVGVE